MLVIWVGLHLKILGRLDLYFNIGLEIMYFGIGILSCTLGLEYDHVL
jgi:hypothetical protein